MEKNIYISTLIARKNGWGNPLSENEEKYLQNWLEQSNSHKLFYESIDIKNTFRTIKDIQESSNEDLQWKRIHLAIQRNKQKKLIISIISGITASIILIIGILFIYKNDKQPKEYPIHITTLTEKITPACNKATIILDNGDKITISDNDTILKTENSQIIVETGIITYMDTQKDIERYNTIIVPYGGFYSMILSDGTRAILNSGSEMVYPLNFTGEKREVFIKGEVYFDVAKSSKKFIVTTQNLKIEVLGTSFNISDYEDEYFVKTTLVSGSLKVCAETEYIISPGQQIEYNKLKHSGILKTLNVDDEIAWKDNLFVFNDEYFDIIIKKLSRWYDVEIEILTDSLKRNQFYGVINKYENIDKILEMLVQIKSFEYEINDRKIIIK